mgnify:CR=1 FL=1|tara:strand:+ start:82 stop:525 length:444 start_codon:yes stop_codon:yes gene_type:complete
MSRLKYFKGGLLRGAVSYATKKFLKDAAKKYPKTIIRESLSKKDKALANIGRKFKILGYTSKKLNDLGEKITSVPSKTGGSRVLKPQKNYAHWKKVGSIVSKIDKDQKKLLTMGDMLQKKGLILRGKKLHHKGGLITGIPKLATKGF